MDTEQPTCTEPTGTIEVTLPKEGTGFEYSIDGRAYQASATFTQLAPGSHILKVKNIATGCESGTTAVIVSPVPPPSAAPIASVTVQPDCSILTATIVVTSPAQGTGFEYNIDGGAWQTSATFTGIAPGTHQLKARNIATGCESGTSILTVNPLPIPPAAPIASVTDQPDCLVLTGTIVVISPAQGTGYQYSIDGGAYQTQATFTGLAPGPHLLKVKHTATGCESETATITVNPLPLPLPAPVAAMTVLPTCTLPTGTIAVTSPAQGTGYQYSIDDGAYRASATFTGLVPGLHRIRVKELATGCESEITSVSVEPIIKIPEPPLASVTSQPSCLILTEIGRASCWERV